MPWLLLFMAALLLLLLLKKVLFPADSSRAAKLMTAYRHMTPELLEKTPDGELVSAVVGNLLAKAEDARLDPYAVIPTLSQERCAVYSIWLLLRELQSNTPANLRQSGQFGFSELAADGLDMLEMPTVAADLRDYLQTADDTRIESIKTALEQADINRRLIDCIRNSPASFCDNDDFGD